MIAQENGFLDRASAIEKLKGQAVWDIIIIGGGATGLGIAVDAASRGYTTLLLEQSDFAKGTSSRSTKLVHGGVRYLANGNIKLVYDALRERGLLIKNAPHLVKIQPFVIPCYSVWDKLKYLAGLKLYDWLSGRLSIGHSTFISKSKMAKLIPGIKSDRLSGGVKYYDGQFDDARLAINLAETSVANGGVVLNYFKVISLLKDGNKIKGVTAADLESGISYQLRGKVVINATGVFVDDILQMDAPENRPLVQPSQGVHLVFRSSFLNSETALMIPKTSDGRVLFAIPWHKHVLIGTTDTPLKKHTLEPKALEEEVTFILKTVQKYLSEKPQRKDVLSVFAGLRPLAAPQKGTDSTKEISRDHKLLVSSSGLITITGGKWTTYRKMAEVTVDKAIETGGLQKATCKTANLPIHGSARTSTDYGQNYSVYGCDYKKIQALIHEDPSFDEKVVEGFPHTWAEVIWAVRHEMARTVEDVLARRLRLLFLNAAAAIKAAPRVAQLMAKELDKDEEWINKQVIDFSAIANNYLLEPYRENSYVKTT